MATPTEARAALAALRGQLAANNYTRQMAAYRAAGGREFYFRFEVTAIHRRVIDAAADLWAGLLTVDEALSVLDDRELRAELLIPEPVRIKAPSQPPYVPNDLRLRNTRPRYRPAVAAQTRPA